MPRRIGPERRYVQNLSRAINKIDEKLTSSFLVASHDISSIKTGINDITYKIDGRERKVRYDQIQSLSQEEQASLWGGLASERTKTREKLALKQLKEKGEISRQFKQSLGIGDISTKIYAGQDATLLENIEELETMMQGNRKEIIKEEFEDLDIEDVESQLDNFFQSDDGNGLTGSDKQFDFFRPGTVGGFSELNTFTMNAYKRIMI